MNQFKSSEVKGKDLGDGTGISYLDMKTTPGCLFFGPALELTGPAKISAKIIMSHRAFLNRDGSGKDQTAFVFDMISDDGRTKIKKWDLTPNMASYTCTAGHHEGSGNSRNFVMPYCDLKGDTTTAEQKKGFPYGDKLAVIAYTLEADLRVPVTDFEIRACNFSKLSTITAVKRIELTVTAN